MEEQADEVRKRRKLSPEDRLQVYREYVAAKAGKQGEVGDLLRRWELHSSDVSRLVRAVEAGVLEQMRERKSRRPRVNMEEVEALRAEKAQLEKTIVAQAAENMILKKKLPLR